MIPSRIHLIAHAGPASKDIRRLGFRDSAHYLAFIRNHLPAPFRLTAGRRFLDARVDEFNAGRTDDPARVRDLQNALDDPDTRAIVASNGGSFFSRILPNLDFSHIARRREPLWAFGFSELTTLVNVIASYPCGRGVYWLCPNYLAWKVRPASMARIAFAQFWRQLPLFFDNAPSRNATRSDAPHNPCVPTLAPLAINGTLVSGEIRNYAARFIGGCISVFAAMLPAPFGRKLDPTDRWLAIEDVNEAPYRVDRHLATLKMAGWFDRIAGLLVGDFHSDGRSDSGAVLKLLKYHLPPSLRLPVVTTRSVGHIWPMSPLILNRPMRIESRRRTVRFLPC